MDVITWLSFVIGLISLVIGIVALAKQNRDKPTLKIISIRPALSGMSNASRQQWNHKISSIEVVIENTGYRPAIDCKGVITFPGMEALPLFPLSNHAVGTSDQLFTVHPESKTHLVGAWNYIGGIIDGTADAPSMRDFLERCTPTTVTIQYGNKKISSELGYSNVKKIFEDHQTELFLGK